MIASTKFLGAAEAVAVPVAVAGSTAIEPKMGTAVISKLLGVAKASAVSVAVAGPSATSPSVQNKHGKKRVDEGPSRSGGVLHGGGKVLSREGKKPDNQGAEHRRFLSF
ncbi:hypothetical protein PIB30_038728 [Stylosanthes scabra]|uniref:Uncharacterized protein n=1 Tax=Stylosanthes scabra TaxID=79078 RepID=A0ABU6SE98_9FABA|nr:hypothetical protein [Stylosanthes scabra]